MKYRICAIVISVILHISAFVPIFGRPPRPQSSQQQITNVKLIPHSEDDVDIDRFSSSINTEFRHNGKAVACAGSAKTYFGVGILYMLGTGLIIDAPENYPAYQAGLRIGDMIKSMNKGPNGEFIDFSVVRGYKDLTFHVKAESICYSGI